LLGKKSISCHGPAIEAVKLMHELPKWQSQWQAMCVTWNANAGKSAPTAYHVHSGYGELPGKNCRTCHKTKVEKPGKRAAKGTGIKRRVSKKAKAAPAVKFKDDNGNVWSGRGPRPAWLRAALEGGAKLESFAA